jgi:hypothetical protein
LKQTVKQFSLTALKPLDILPFPRYRRLHPPNVGCHQTYLVLIRRRRNLSQILVLQTTIIGDNFAISQLRALFHRFKASWLARSQRFFGKVRQLASRANHQLITIEVCLVIFLRIFGIYPNDIASFLQLRVVAVAVETNIV